MLQDTKKAKKQKHHPENTIQKIPSGKQSQRRILLYWRFACYGVASNISFALVFAKMTRMGIEWARKFPGAQVVKGAGSAGVFELSYAGLRVDLFEHARFLFRGRLEPFRREWDSRKGTGLTLQSCTPA